MEHAYDEFNIEIGKRIKKITFTKRIYKGILGGMCRYIG